MGIEVRLAVTAGMLVLVAVLLIVARGCKLRAAV